MLYTGMKGLPVQGGWNKGLRYGKKIPGELRVNEPVKCWCKVNCECGKCRRCIIQVYNRVRYRLKYSAKARKVEPTDDELDARAAVWLKNLEKERRQR